MYHGFMLRRYCALLAATVQCLILAQTTPEARTRHVLDLWLAGNYDAIHAMWDDQMKAALPLDTYRAQSEELKALGKVGAIGEPGLVRRGKYAVVTIRLDFPSTALNFIVSWDEQGQIAGMWMAPPAAPAPAWQPPTYAKPDSFTAREVTIGAEPWKLPGTLTVPKGKRPLPAVVLVHGSGPHDRDETVGAAKVFRDVAQGLSSRGIAVLRYVKRTKQYPQQCAADKNFTMTQETVDDAVAAAVFLRTQPEIDPRRVFVLGHSQGGYMAPRIGARDPKLAGLIVMAGNVRPLEQVIQDQLAYLGATSAPMPHLPEAYMRDLEGYNPAVQAAKLTLPMLVLQGERDYQVTMKDFNLWKAALSARGNVTFHSYPKLNHLFIAGEGKSLPAEYETPGHVDAQVIEDIAGWIERQR